MWDLSIGDSRDDFDNSNQAMKVIEKYENKISLKEGDFVQRKQEICPYQYPKNNQVAKVLKVFDDYQILEGGHAYNGIILVAIDKTTLRTFGVDLSMYQKQKTNKNVINLFRKKG